jgi:hypothetical protein
VPDHSTFSKNRHGRFRDSDLLRLVFVCSSQNHPALRTHAPAWVDRCSGRIPPSRYGPKPPTHGSANGGSAPLSRVVSGGRRLRLQSPPPQPTRR